MSTLLTHLHRASPRAVKQIGGQRWGQTLRLLSLSSVRTAAKDVKSESKPQSSPSLVSQSPVETGDLEPRLSLAFTCTVADCGTRSSHTFTRRSYEKGIVIVQCPGCRNRSAYYSSSRPHVPDCATSHLIADHLGWFKDSTEDGKLRTIEDILRARGERVRRGQLNTEGVVEYVES
jgi:protein import protein ZIM17